MSDPDSHVWPPRVGLSGRLLALTIGFVMLAEVLIFVPSIARFRLDFLEERLAAAQIASLALEATPNRIIDEELERELLENAEVRAVALKRDNIRVLMLVGELPEMVDRHYDLRNAGPFTLIMDAFDTFWAGGDRVIRVVGNARFGGGDMTDIVMDEAPLRAAMFVYGRNILGLSIVISLITATLVFVTLNRIFVRPIHRLTGSMVQFRQNPEDASRLIEPSSRRDELGMAQRELAVMQRDVRAALRQKTHLAQLGSAVSKINHDLRNILASAQLISDRLAHIDDPTVQRLTPRLIHSIDRAIRLCTDTLRYGRGEEPPPARERMLLQPLVDEVGTAVGIPSDGSIVWQNDVDPETEIDADPQQLYRILLNLGRNAVQALEASEPGERYAGSITLSARRSENATEIEVRDNGPGLSSDVRDRLFEPFGSSGKGGGFGLGLAIAREAARSHGGDLTLLESGPAGTAFLVRIPDRAEVIDHRTGRRTVAGTAP